MELKKSVTSNVRNFLVQISKRSKLESLGVSATWEKFLVVKRKVWISASKLSYSARLIKSFFFNFFKILKSFIFFGFKMVSKMHSKLFILTLNSSAWKCALFCFGRSKIPIFFSQCNISLRNYIQNVNIKNCIDSYGFIMYTHECIHFLHVFVR